MMYEISNFIILRKRGMKNPYASRVDTLGSYFLLWIVLLHWNDQVKEDEVVRACSTNGVRGLHGM
jgi:hypothetical protein